MSYLDRLKDQNSEKQATKALSKLPKAPYDSFGSSQGGHFSENNEPAPDTATDPLLIEVWTPSGTPLMVRADNADHAAWLRRMNPKPTNPAPKPDLTTINLEE